MRYVLLFVETEQFEKEMEALGPEDRARAFQLVRTWFADHAGKITNVGSKLQDAHTATTVRLHHGQEPIITDGPFVEGKEIVSGYCEIDVDNLDEALRMLRTWPGCPVVEIRPILELQASPPSSVP